MNQSVVGTQSSSAGHSSSPSARYWLIATTSAVLLGVVLRLFVGISKPGLWFDEVFWFDRIMNGFLHGIRAHGYTYLHYFYFSGLSSFEEYKVRLLSIVTGAAFVPLFAFTVHRLFQTPWTTFLGTLLVAINVSAISFTHEFKPYALDLFFHTAWFCSLFLCRDKKDAVLLGSAVLLVGLSLSYSLIPLIPFQLAYVAYLYWKREISLLDLLVCVALFAVYTVYFSCVYADIKGANPDRWGKKYGVFFVESVHGPGVVNYLRWFFAKFSTYLSYPLNWYQEISLEHRGAGFPGGHGYVESWVVGVALAVLFGYQLLRVRLDDVRMVPLYLLLGYTVAGVLKIFPLGFFRANLFLLVYALLAFLFLLQEFVRFLQDRSAKVGFVGLVLVPTVIASWNAPLVEKHFYSVPLAQELQAICDANPSGQTSIFVSHKMVAPISFYRRKVLSPSCKNRLKIDSFLATDSLDVSLSKVATRSYIFFVPSTKTPSGDIEELLVHKYQARLLAEGGGLREYVVHD